MQTSGLQHIAPSVHLQDDVREYQVFRFLFDKSVTPPFKFHAPRPEHCITFYLRDPQKSGYIDSSVVHTYPACVINGMYTVPLKRYGGKDFWAIKIVLKPSTLYRLIKI